MIIIRLRKVMREIKAHTVYLSWKGESEFLLLNNVDPQIPAKTLHLDKPYQ